MHSAASHPAAQVITSEIDEHIDGDLKVVPGVGNVSGSPPRPAPALRCCCCSGRWERLLCSCGRRAVVPLFAGWLLPLLTHLTLPLRPFFLGSSETATSAKQVGGGGGAGRSLNSGGGCICEDGSGGCDRGKH